MNKVTTCDICNRWMDGDCDYCDRKGEVIYMEQDERSR